MKVIMDELEIDKPSVADDRRDSRSPGRRRIFLIYLGTGVSVMAALGVAASAWLVTKATTIESELAKAAELVAVLQDNILQNDPLKSAATAQSLAGHTSSAHSAAADPVWSMAGSLPWIGGNFRAVREIAVSANDVARHGAIPLVAAAESLDWKALTPADDYVDLEPLTAASPKLIAGANAVKQSSDRLNRVDTATLLPQVSEPLVAARDKLTVLSTKLDAAADAASVAPKMLGSSGTRSYLLMVQNNAEVRASGGIPGALAVLTLNDGKLTLGAQSSAGEVGIMSPPIAVDKEQEQIYSTRLGKYMQDVNLTPDFPTAAATAQAMWEQKTGQRVDGVISMDPISLGYVLDATGPVKLTEPEPLALAGGGLPTQLTGKNVVPTLLSDVYAKIPLPKYQDAYFAGVAKEIFGALSTGGFGDAKGLIDGISRGTSEGRILLWSAAAQEQSVLAKYPVSGSIDGPSVAPAQFGVYFNDGTGAKMDYHVKRTVQLVKKCDTDGYEETAVRITSTNTAQADAATSLPPYVTGAGVFGVPAGFVRTNVIAYGPVQANVETASVDGKKADFSAQRHADRPVGTVTITLAPGQSSTVELTFGKIVQHTEPNVVVTPTVQPVKDVILSTENAVCNQRQ